jgi:hypothetical protein
MFRFNVDFVDGTNGEYTADAYTIVAGPIAYTEEGRPTTIGDGWVHFTENILTDVDPAFGYPNNQMRQQINVVSIKISDVKQITKVGVVG